MRTETAQESITIAGLNGEYKINAQNEARFSLHTKSMIDLKQYTRYVRIVEVDQPMTPDDTLSIDGVLTINLEPPYFSFQDLTGAVYARNCTREEVRDALDELGNLNWPLEDCVVRLPGQYNLSRLNKLQLF